MRRDIKFFNPASPTGFYNKKIKKKKNIWFFCIKIIFVFLPQVIVFFLLWVMLFSWKIRMNTHCFQVCHNRNHTYLNMFFRCSLKNFGCLRFFSSSALNIVTANGDISSSDSFIYFLSFFGCKILVLCIKTSGTLLDIFNLLYVKIIIHILLLSDQKALIFKFYFLNLFYRLFDQFF